VREQYGYKKANKDPHQTMGRMKSALIGLQWPFVVTHARVVVVALRPEVGAPKRWVSLISYDLSSRQCDRRQAVHPAITQPSPATAKSCNCPVIQSLHSYHVSRNPVAMQRNALQSSAFARHIPERLARGRDVVLQNTPELSVTQLPS
jgi:hypothetical protein